MNSAVGSAALLVTVEEVSRDIFGDGVCGLLLLFLWISSVGGLLLFTAASFLPTGSSEIDILRMNIGSSQYAQVKYCPDSYKMSNTILKVKCVMLFWGWNLSNKYEDDKIEK